MRRLLLLLALLPNCTGCLAYAYPTLAYTPEVAVENRDGSAHAFRVDIDRTDRTQMATSAQYTLTQIPLDRGGVIPSQLELASASGVYNPFGIGDTKEHERSQYTMVIRLYKPGSQTMEVQSWDKSKAVQWLPAATLAEQEKAIDELLADPEAPLQALSDKWAYNLNYMQLYNGGRVTWWQLKDQKDPGLGLQPGVISPSQRQALHFAASEYGRLANSPAATGPNMQAARERLIQKANWLQRYADGKGQ